jgi:lipoprotein-anchoring transpeptidase ErfK/SrfK
MRYFFALFVIVAGVAGGLAGYKHLNAGLQVVLPKPHEIEVSTSAGQLLPGGWANTHVLSLQAAGFGSVTAGLDVEVRHAGKPFTGVPTITTPNPGAVAANCTTCVNGAPAVTVHLGDGDWHVQVRLHNKQGISPWRSYGRILHVDTVPPALPAITSATDPDPKQTYHASTVAVAWQTSDYGSGISGYSYRVDTTPNGDAPTHVRTTDTHVSLTGLQTGTYYFHVRAIDAAGNWGGTSTFPVKIDVTPPGLDHVRFSAYDFNPQISPLTVSFGVTKAAKSIHVGVYRQNDGKLVRFYRLADLPVGRTTSVTWAGNDSAGRAVPSGSYEVYVRTTDKYGHSAVQGWRDFIINRDRIVVSLSQQRLVAYEDGKVFLSSLVTTGNKALPTPTGTFSISEKVHPFTFISPWPKTSPFYYKPSKVHYAMLFRSGGYYIHDAPWRTAFGPGTNAQTGTPGSNYTGTHGCINVPEDVATRLFAWAPIGTVVQVVP